jgi:hypothetical protein
MKPSPKVIRRRRITVIGAAGGVVVAAALVSAFAWPGFAIPEPLPTPTVTVQAPIPTPTIAPAERLVETTPLLDALPDKVLAFVQQGIEPFDSWKTDHTALEAWTLTYADGEGAASTKLTLDLGQWATETFATSFFDAQVLAAGEPTMSGDVLVGETAVGQYAMFESATGASTIWWRNATVVFRLTGPADVIADFYTAFPV